MLTSAPRLHRPVDVHPICETYPGLLHQRPDTVTVRHRLINVRIPLIRRANLAPSAGRSRSCESTEGRPGVLYYVPSEQSTCKLYSEMHWYQRSLVGSQTSKPFSANAFRSCTRKIA